MKYLNVKSSLFQNTESKLFVLRISVLISLVCSTVLFGGLSYIVFYELEGQRLHSQYDSIKGQFAYAIEHEIEDKKNSLVVLSQYLKSEFPNASSWPNVAIPMDTFKKMTDPLIEMGTSRTVSYSPVLKPEDVATYENFTYSFFKEQGYPDLGVSDFGKGVSARNTTTGDRYHDVDSSSAAGSREILVPVHQIGNLDQNGAAIMYNIYSEANRAAALDFVLDCSDASDCTAVTDFIYIVQDTYFRPAALMMHPVFGFDAKGDNVTTGVVVAVFNWDDVLQNSVPTYADGLEATIISSSGAESIFQFESGEAILKNKASSSARDSFYSVSVDLQHTSFTINLSPTEEFIAQYRSRGPLISSIFAISIILIVSGIFVIYDLAINREKREKEIIAETKRLFVRYISHEIRTPLNTVHLGLQVLHGEMTELINSGTREQIQEAMKEWTKFIADIDESTEDAITVVSDLLDFDKASNGMLSLERGIHNMYSLIHDTIKPFEIQAKSKNIILNCESVENLKLNNNFDNNFNENNHHEENGSHLVVHGDFTKIQQIIRNLISNALKFTPENGQVTITAQWNLDSNMSDKVSCPNNFSRCGSIVVKVKDSGAGMTPEQVGQLFQEGVQFDANKLQAGQGSGLGLWIAKGVVEQHSGKLSAISEGKGFGAEFIFEVPVCLPLETTKAWPMSSLFSSSSTSTPHGPPPSSPFSDSNSPIYPPPKAAQMSFPSKLPGSGFSSSFHGHNKKSSSPLPSPSNVNFHEGGLTHLVEGVLNLPQKSVSMSGPSVASKTGSTATTPTSSVPSTPTAPPSSSLPSWSTTSLLQKKEKEKIKELEMEPKQKKTENVSRSLIRRVLVVDDAASTRKVMCRLLKNINCETVEAANGQECLDIIARKDPLFFDLILMDYEMPIMNGPEAVSKLNELGYTIPVIGVTGNVLKADTDYFIEKGAIEVLHKPLNIAVIKNLLNRFNLMSKTFALLPQEAASVAIASMDMDGESNHHKNFINQREISNASSSSSSSHSGGHSNSNLNNKSNGKISKKKSLSWGNLDDDDDDDDSQNELKKEDDEQEEWFMMALNV
mmetsp:Transcript_42809/g.55014  ORF Transcript_42809/g.55014 Transcript_42809/m.55014 type:complete len:1070 (+) Transcript_42809:88-3297(+)